MTTSPITPDTKRLAKRAAGFVPNPDLERITQEVAAGTITPTPTLRMELGYYQSAKDAARAAERKTA